MENIRDVRLDFRPAKSRYSVSNPVIIRYLKAEQEAQKMHRWIMRKTVNVS